MPITPYVRPQETITQILRQTAVAATTRRNPLVIGPQFKLLLNDGRELAKSTFNSDGGTLAFQVSEGGVVSALDASLYTPYLPSAKLHGENLLAKTNSADVVFDRISGDTSAMRLTSGSSGYITKGTAGTDALVTALNGRSVKVGDSVKVTSGVTSVYRKITAILPSRVAAAPTSTPSATVYAMDTTVTAAVTAAALFRIAGPYTGASDRRYIVEAVAVGASGSIKVYDATGQVPVATYSVNTTAAFSQVIGDGVTLSTTGAVSTLAAGHKLYFDVTAEAASNTSFNAVRLDGPLPGTSGTVNVDVYQVFSGEITADNSASGVAPAYLASGVEYGDDLGLSAAVTGASTFSYFVNAQGKVLVSYKAIVKPLATEGAIAITSASSISSTLGELSYDNDLGRGVAEAFKGNQSRKVYALRTAGVTEADFAAALNKIRTSDVYYALAVMTEDEAVMKLVATHCEEMSNKYNRNFRRCYVGTDSPGAYTKLGKLANGNLRTASLSNKIVTLDTAFRASTSFLTSVAVGDTLTFVSLPGYVVKSIISAYELELDIPASAGSVSLTGVGFSVTAKDSAENTALFVQARNQALSSRRCVNVWSDAPVYSGDVVPMRFVAAEIAGLRCALLPQQGLTMTEVSSITSAPSMYTRYSPELLDQIASHGTMIITQESEGGEVFVRHQLTTETEEGALAYEDSVGVIVDDFSYSEKDLFRGFIGKKNATRDTIEEMRVKLKQLALDSTQTDYASRDVGPPVIRFFDINDTEGEVTVRISGELADHIETYVRLRVPLPINGIDNYIDVETSNLL